MLTNLKSAAASIALAWKSLILAKAGGANLKILRMDETEHEKEVHPYAEALIVIEGCMKLLIDNDLVEVQAGELFLVPAGLRHGIAAGSKETLVIIDPDTAACRPQVGVDSVHELPARR